MSRHLERVLLVAGAPNTGKSTQLRSMFLDPRLGTAGEIPDARKVRETIALSPHRRLYLRLTSPHEMAENPARFFKKIAAATADGRWNVASAVQVDAAKRMPRLPQIVDALAQRFAPERIRVALLSPDRHGITLENIAEVMGELREIPSCEVLAIDGRTRTANGLLLSDTFDFS